ncbi:MAG TPA: ABC transporter substrate-binding protein [Anaerolineae bacterium]|nr:ABC transporter substrate-binding protein [Anaerolineae bacterium]
MKKFVLVAVFAVIAMIAIACAPAAPTAVPTQPPQPTSPPAPTSAPAPTNAPAPTSASAAPTGNAPAPTTAASVPEPAAKPTWIQWHDPAAEKSELFDKMNGTGAFKLEAWKPGEEVDLVANEDYWVKEPLWEGGPSGAPKLKRVVVKEVDEFGTRFAALQAGDADFIDVDPQYYPQLDPLVKEECDYKTNKCTPTANKNGILRVFKNLPGVGTTDLLLNVNINTEGGNNYIGSGALDGNGIPPDFFKDVHIRKAFNYCFDYDTYIKEVLQGDGLRRNGPVINPMLGYNDKGPRYDFDLQKCADEFKASEWKTADGKSLWDTGFYIQLTYNSGNITRKTISEIYKQSLEQINPNFHVEVFALPWPVFLKERTARRLPIYTIGWLEDYHDPHNWVVPYLASYGAFAGGVPQDLQATADDMVAKAAAETDQKKREQDYFDIQKWVYDNAINVYLDQTVGRHYENVAVQGWFYNPIYTGNVAYAYRLSKDPKSKNPDTYTYYAIGDAESLDPAFTYETFGSMIEQSVYESPLFFKRESVTEFVPSLAEKWSLSDDGKTYTFNIRKGIKFHDGTEMKASDIAYAIQRGLLQDRTDGPQNLLLNPIFGVPSIAALAAKEAGLQEAPEKFEDIPAAGLVKACEDVLAAVSADDSTNTLTIKLNAPFAAWPQLMSQPWTSAIPKAWVIKNGGWDGKCTAG